MSKLIDTTNPEALTIAERLYLQDRGQLPAELAPISQEERMASYADVELPPDTSNEYDGWSRKQLCKELKRRKLPLEGTNTELSQRLQSDDALRFVTAIEADKNARANADTSAGDPENDGDVALEDMKKDELVALAESRGIDASGKKADIIERLQAS